jgi:hypothetical protein
VVLLSGEAAVVWMDSRPTGLLLLLLLLLLLTAVCLR